MELLPDKETMRSFLGMINYLNRYSALNAGMGLNPTSDTMIKYESTNDDEH